MVRSDISKSISQDIFLFLSICMRMYIVEQMIIFKTTRRVTGDNNSKFVTFVTFYQFCMLKYLYIIVL